MLYIHCLDVENVCVSNKLYVSDVPEIDHKQVIHFMCHSLYRVSGKLT